MAVPAFPFHSASTSRSQNSLVAWIWVGQRRAHRFQSPRMHNERPINQSAHWEANRNPLPQDKTNEGRSVMFPPIKLLQPWTITSCQVFSRSSQFERTDARPCFMNSGLTLPCGSCAMAAGKPLINAAHGHMHHHGALALGRWVAQQAGQVPVLDGLKRGAFLFADFVCCVRRILFAVMVSLLVPSVNGKLCVFGEFLCGRGFSFVPSVELERTEKAILSSDDMGFRKQTWKLTHSQVICLVPCVSGLYKSHVIRQKEPKKDNAKHHQPNTRLLFKRCHLSYLILLYL